MIASKSILTAMILGLAGGASCATAAKLPRCPTVTEQRNPYDYHYARLMESKLYSRDFKINVAQGVDNGLSDEEALEYGRAKVAEMHGFGKSELDFNSAMREVELKEQIEKYKVCKFYEVELGVHGDLVTNLDRDKIERQIEEAQAKIAAQTDDCIYEKIKGDSTSAAIAEIRRICRSRALRNI
ncbi:hypothetical protein VP3220_62 [Vibrio phage vB_VpaP_VP-3220]|uniref:hypothetical protein n=1 Tax=Vibrio parahaemolyticus TaxID=670 RepID=UPI000429396E|nr:hypothetical protein [Vibrio parahaemolyticus]VVL20185.1 hypothetical protein VP3220_62 [Vibrio phage vB_VpaP_VP-3220]